LAAQLFRDLVKRFLQLLELVSNLDDSPASLARQLLHFGVARIPSEPVEATIRYQQHVTDRVRFLRGLDRILDSQLAPLVLAVREQDHRLPPDLVRKLVVRREVYRIVEQRPPRVAGRNRTSTNAWRPSAETRIDARLIQSCLQQVHIVCEVLQQI